MPLILIESPNIFHWKSAKESTVSESLGQNLGQIQAFANGGKGWGGFPQQGESEILLGGGLPGEGNLRKSDFDDSNLFQC